MVKEDIVTALRNSVERGDTLENAIKIMISSGYSPGDVQEASNFVGFVPMSSKNNSFVNSTSGNNPPVSQPIISKMPIPPQLPLPQSQLQQIQQFSFQNQRYPNAQQLPQRHSTNNDIKSEISSVLPMQTKPMPLIQQMPMQYKAQPPPTKFQQPPVQQQVLQQSSIQSAEEPEKPNYTKEIILLIVLLILIGILIVTIVFRNKILTFFS